MEIKCEKSYLSNSTKCGELFVSKNGKLLYSCSFCTEFYNSSDLFADHLDLSHSNLNLVPKQSSASAIDLSKNHDLSTSFNVSELNDHDYNNTNSSLEVLQKEKFQNIDERDLSEKSKQTTDDIGLSKLKVKPINPLRKLGRPKKCETNANVTQTDNTQYSTDETNASSNTKVPVGFWQCMICTHLCKKGEERREHEKLHQKESINSIGVICETCGKGFKNQRILSVHIRTHTGERPYKCQFCPMAFGQSGALHNHERQHTGEKPFKCNYCEKRFIQSGLCRTHELIHTLSEKPYGCHVCEKRFLRPHNLADHIKTHNYKPHKPFPCPTCPKFFKSLSSLKVHEIFHREEAYQFQCDYCEKKFVKLVSKQRHELIHTQAGQLPYECLDCGKKYAHDTSLAKHRKKHHSDSEAPPPRYKCAHCERIFLKLKSKDKHQQGHKLGPPSYKCHLCSRSFAFKHGLKKHQRRKHNTE